MARIAAIAADHAWLAPLLAEIEAEDHECLPLGMSQQALQVLREVDLDLVLLAWHWNEQAYRDYLNVLRRTTDLPIFVLAPCYDEEQTVATLRAGADVCVSLPISSKELTARISAQLRRYAIWAEDEAAVVQPEPIEAPPDAVVIEGRMVELSNIERRLLDRLQEQSGAVVSRDELCDHVWGADGDARYTNLSLVVYNLRKKLERNPHHPRYLLTKWGVGYYLSQDLSQAS